MSEWQNVTFENAPLQIIDGDRGLNYPKQSDFSVQDYCLFLNAGNVTSDGFNFSNCQFISKKKDSQLRKGKLTPEDIVLTTRGTVGNVAYYSNSVPFQNIRINSGMIIIRPNLNEIIPQYLYLYLRSLLFQNQVAALMTGSAQPQLPIRDIRHIHLMLPPLSEQRAIAHILGSLDDKIEANRRMNATLEATARALFKSWFVDFDPVHYKSRGEQPPGMDAETAALFPDSFEDSELGPIPAGWGVGTIGDIAEFNSWTLSKKDRLDPIDYIEISEVMRGEIGLIKTYTRGEEPSRARRRLRHGDTVLSTVRPDRGAYFLCLNPSPHLIASTGFAIFTPKSECWSFLHSALIRTEVFERLGFLADGAAYPAIAPEMIAALPLVIPSAEVMKIFHIVSSQLYELAEQNRISSRTLAETRDALLPKLVSGELRVGELG